MLLGGISKVVVGAFRGEKERFGDFLLFNLKNGLIHKPNYSIDATEGRFTLASMIYSIG